jgi:RsiW-degrading membrane proteinase PrsW (M82 family)
MAEYVILGCKIILITVVLWYTFYILKALKGKTKSKWILTQLWLGILLLFVLVYKLYYLLGILGYIG